MKERIERILDGIRPLIRKDGGDVELAGIDAVRRVVSVRLTGACVHCPLSEITLKTGIEAAIKKEIPEVREVISVA